MISSLRARERESSEHGREETPELKQPWTGISTFSLLTQACLSKLLNQPEPPGPLFLNWDPRTFLSGLLRGVNEKMFAKGLAEGTHHMGADCPVFVILLFTCRVR